MAVFLFQYSLFLLLNGLYQSFYMHINNFLCALEKLLILGFSVNGKKWNSSEDRHQNMIWKNCKKRLNSGDNLVLKGVWADWSGKLATLASPRCLPHLLIPHMYLIAESMEIQNKIPCLKMFNKSRTGSYFWRTAWLRLTTLKLFLLPLKQLPLSCFLGTVWCALSPWQCQTASGRGSLALPKTQPRSVVNARVMWLCHVLFTCIILAT